MSTIERSWAQLLLSVQYEHSWAQAERNLGKIALNCAQLRSIAQIALNCAQKFCIKRNCAQIALKNRTNWGTKFSTVFIQVQVIIFYERNWAQLSAVERNWAQDERNMSARWALIVTNWRMSAIEHNWVQLSAMQKENSFRELRSTCAQSARWAQFERFWAQLSAIEHNWAQNIALNCACAQIALRSAIERNMSATERNMSAKSEFWVQNERNMSAILALRLTCILPL